MAKIEKREALLRLEEIVAEADAVMVARGDLGVEIDVAQMPIEQKRIIAACHRFQRPAIIATQMLDSMQDSPRPTRAEATDVANAILDGADACMLSGETAIGQFPLEAVEMMNRIALATESSFQNRPPRSLEGTCGQRARYYSGGRVRAAGQMAYELDAKSGVRRQPLGPHGVRAIATSAAMCRRSASAHRKRRCGKCACTGA